MTATLINSGTYAFNDGNGGHSIDLGSAPNVDEVDILCVNSNTVVTTPTGFTAAPTRVNSQGSYIYRRKAVGGEGQTVTITTSGNHETAVGWSRWSGIDAADDTASSGVDGSGGTSTPAHSTGTLTASTELIIAFGALHSLGALPSSPVWAGGYTALTAVTQGSGSTGVTNYVAYKQPVGTAAESPSVSWTGSVSDRYMLTITFTTAAAGTNAPAESTSVTGAANNAAITVSPAAEAATATGTANDATVTITANAETAGTAGTALDPTPNVGPAAEFAAVAATAFDAGITVYAFAECATCTIAAFTPPFTVAAVKATSVAAVTDRNTSTATVTARNTSTGGVT